MYLKREGGAAFIGWGEARQRHTGEAGQVSQSPEQLEGMELYHFNASVFAFTGLF